MVSVRALLSLSALLVFSACSETQDISDPMRTEFLSACEARPEYERKRRDGTIDRYCGCLFDRTMKGLTEDQRILAGFYLYGEQSEAFKTRYTLSPDLMEHIGLVSKAIDRAAKTCR